MIKNIFRNLTRFKSSTFLNIVGLSSAFAVFMIVSMQIRYDFTYDKHHKDYERIYQLVRIDTIKGKSDVHWPRPWVTQIKNNLAEIEYISVSEYSYNAALTIIKDNDGELNVREDIHRCEEDFPKVFNFDFIEGDESALKDWNNVIVSDDFAKKYYGDESPIGKVIMIYSQSHKIAAVYKAFARNSTIQGDVFVNVKDKNINNAGNWNYYVYFTSHKEIESIKEFGNQIADILFPERENEPSFFINAVQLTDVRYIVDGDNPYMIHVMILLVVSILVLASINFVNFSISVVPLKIKGINLRKVVGVSNHRLRLTVVVEALFLTLCSFTIAVFLVELFKDSNISSFISDMSWVNNKLIYLFALIVSVLVGLFASIYPAIYSTSFPPALVLKSSFALSGRGRQLRKYLIGFQFLTALVFISIAIFIQLQYNHLLTRDGGYNREGVLHINHGWTYNKHDALKSELLTHANIEDVTFCLHAFGTENGGMGWGGSCSKGQLYIHPVCVVAHNFLDFFEIEILEGRDFMTSDDLSEKGSWVMSKLLMDTYEIDINESITSLNKTADIIGICENVNIVNMKTELEPFGFHMLGKNPYTSLPDCYVRFTANPEGVIEHIRASYEATDPNVIVTINFMDDEFKAAYAEEGKIRNIMQSLSFISILIALLGVYGLVTFDTRFRRKEISLRKINGASVSNVLAMFCVAYLKIVVISFVISIPIVFVVIRDWLSVFPYRIPVYWWVFALAFLFVALLTLAISLVQTYTAARTNPINQLKEN